jgi:hypothetical protein
VTLITNPGHENHENTEHEPECTVKMTLSLARQAAWPFGRENLLWLKSCIFMIGGAWIPKKVIKLPSRVRFIVDKVDWKVRCHTSSKSATTIRHRAGLNGEPIGEPQICSKTQVPIEN